jgi:hypothetical protein
MSDDRSPTIRLSSFVGSRVYPILIPGNPRACNPSIAVNGEGFRAIVRTVNYDLDDAGVCISLPGGFHVSSNWLVEFDRNLMMTGLRSVDDDAVRTGDRPIPGGFEDCRLFRWKDAWWFFASVVVDQKPITTRMVLCRLDDARVAECHFISSPIQATIEKNWMPCFADDDLSWIYRIDPMQLVHYRADGAPVMS